MTFLQLYSTQLDIELSSDDTTHLFTTARRKKAVQDAELAFIRQTGCTRKYGTIAIVDGTAEYNMLTTLTDFLRLAEKRPPSIKKIVTATSVVTWIQGKDFPYKEVELLDIEEPGWRDVDAGTPTSWYTRTAAGVMYLGATPAPDVPSTETWSWLIPYVASTTAMSATGDFPFTVGAVSMVGLAPYHQALVHYAAAQLEPLRKNYAVAKDQMAKYASYVADYLTQNSLLGSDEITFARDYLGESRRGSTAVDWRRYP